MRYLACALALLTVVGAVQPPAADASCNLVPVAQKRFASTLGGVESPISSPGNTVTLLINSCDSSPGFEPIASDNEVELRFEPPGGGAATVVAIDSNDPNVVQVSDCTMPGGRCHSLSFTTPATAGLLPPHGLAGPASITVRDSSTAVIAQIGALSLPAYSCDREPETVFEQFTVLPPPNSFADAVSGSLTELRATVDGGGDLLVPFDYWGGGSNSVLAETPGAPVAIFLGGSAAIPAMGAGDPNTIQQVIAAQASPSDFLRSFTLDGRPLPPLLRITATGELLGSADAVESVLRIARNDGKGGADLYDLSDRLFMGRGPVVITSFTTTRKNPIPLKSLRSSGHTVAFARDEAREDAILNGDGDKNDLVMEIVDAQTGTATDTSSAVTETSTLLPNPFVGAVFAGAPAVDVSGDLAAFLESEAGQGVDRNADLDFDDSFLRVFDRNGTDLTGALDAEAAPIAVVDGRPLVVRGSHVFYRSPNPFVGARRNGVDSVVGLDDPVNSALSPDGKHLYVTSTSNAAVTVFARDSVTGRLTFVESDSTASLGSAMAVVVSPDGHHVYVTCVTSGGVLVFARSTLTGHLTFIEQHQDGVGGEFDLGWPVGIATSPDGTNVYLASQGSPAVVSYTRNVSTGSLTFLGSSVNAFGFPFGVLVSPDGKNVYLLNNMDPLPLSGSVKAFDRSPIDGSLTTIGEVPILGPIPATAFAISPDGAHIYAGTFGWQLIYYFARDPLTGQLDNPQQVPSLAGLGGNPYVDGDNEGPIAETGGGIVVSDDGSRVYSSGPAAGYWGQLNTFIRNERTGALTYTSSDVEGLGGVPPADKGAGPVSLSPDGRFVYTTSGEGDSVLTFRTDVELRVFDAQTHSVLASHPTATVVRTAGEKAVLLTNEATTDADLNADGDKTDEVAQLLDASGGNDSVVSLGVAANRIAMSDEIAAITVPEHNDGDTDLNGDGDENDDVLAIIDLETDQLTDTQLAAERIAVSGTKVVFAVKEGDGTVGSVNGDGDTDDRVLRIYDAGTGELTELAMAVSSFAVKGPILAFLVPEAGQGFTDLNGDLDDNDHVMFVYHLDTGELVATHHAARACDLPGTCERYRPYSIDLDRQTVTFLENEFSQTADLNGDGDSGDVVLQVFSLRSHAPQSVGTVIYDSDPDVDENLLQKIPPFPERLLEDDISFQQVRETDIGPDTDNNGSPDGVDVNDDGVIDDALVSLVAGDSDRDGTFDDFDGCVDKSNPDGLDLDGDGLGDSACDPRPAVCPPSPLVGCKHAAPGKASLGIKSSSDDRKDTLSWKWSKGDATTLDDIGNPVSGQAHYSLCVYDSSGNAQPLVSVAAAAQAGCEKGPCWKTVGTKGYGYKDKAAHTAGTTLLKLGAGGAAKAKASYKGKGALLEIPTLPPTTPVTVQLIVNENGRQDCWEATYSTFSKSDAAQFKAKSD